MKKRPFELWLIWQNSETRQWYHIGNLSSENGVFQFSYENCGDRRTLKEAMENGYKPHLAFPNINRTYTSDQLFGPFERRLPDKRRPDFNQLLKELGLPLDYTDLDLLRATNGRLATDSYQFISPLFIEGNHFELEFFVNGWRYYEGEQVIHQLKAGDQVRFKLDPDNQKDDKAVVVLTDSAGHKLGFIPAYYSGFMFDAIRSDCTYEARVEKVSPDANPQRKVNILVVGELNSRFNVKATFMNNNQLQLIKH